MDVLHRYRHRNLPDLLDVTAMRTAGVPEGMVGRTHAALRFLGLLTDANEPTDDWRQLADADETSFPAALGAAVRMAYRDIFALVDPASDGQERVKSAFQPFQPKSQIDRMVTLFLGLCAESGMPTKDAPKRRATKAQQGEETKGRIKVAAPEPRSRRTPTPLPPPPAPGESTTVTLRGGGTLTLTVSTKFFDLSPEDRAFVFNLRDELSSYERQRMLPAPRTADVRTDDLPDE